MPLQYTSEQLVDIGRPIEEHAIAELRTGDLAGLRELVDRMATGHSGLDAMSVHTLARKVGKLRQGLGEEKARGALARVGT